MSKFEILVPDLPESVVDATLVKWHKKTGESIQRDEVLLEVETDKIVLEVPAPQAGVVEKILVPEGETVQARQLVAVIVLADQSGIAKTAQQHHREGQVKLTDFSPAVRRLLAEHDLDPALIKAESGDSRLTVADVKHYLAKGQINQKVAIKEEKSPLLPHRSEKRVPMSRLRQRVAERLLQAKNTTAMLTTFNEVNMQPVIQLRQKYGEAFEKKHDVRLGFMSFYLKAVVEALKRYPEINASLDDNDVVYHNYFDISVAVSTPRGLVTPVLRDVDAQSMADLEKNLKGLANRGRENKLSVDDLSGGTFTISNGGVFGSLMSTPIINPPQCAILGLHAIKDRPMAVEGQIVILPMMYLALSYDHRLIDGREAIGFLVTIKELLEDPTRILLDI